MDFAIAAMMARSIFVDWSRATRNVPALFARRIAAGLTKQTNTKQTAVHRQAQRMTNIDRRAQFPQQFTQVTILCRLPH